MARHFRNALGLWLARASQYTTRVPPEIDPALARSTGQRTCPECGWTEGAAALRRPARSRAARAAGLVTLLAAAAIVLWLSLTAERATISSGGSVPFIAEPAFTPADIERIARGEPADPARPSEAVLTRAILAAAYVRTPEYPGSHAVEVGYGPAPGQRMDLWSIGWPTPWLACVRQPNYEDAARRSGPRPTVTDHAAPPTPKWEMPRDPLNLPPRARWEWFGNALHYQPPPEETGGVTTTWWIAVFAPAVQIGAVVLAWYVCGLVVWGINRFRARDRRRRHMRTRVAVAAAVGLGFVVASIVTAGQKPAPLPTFPKLTQVGAPPAPVTWSRAGFARLPFMRDELERLADAPAADRRVAEAILALNLPPGPAGAEGPVYLAAAADCETQYAYDGSHDCTAWTLNRVLPVVYSSRLFYVRRPDFGPTEIVAPPAGVRAVSEQQRWFGLEIATGDAAKPVYRVLVEPTILGSIIVLLWLIFWTTRLVTLVCGRIARARRLRRGRCPACAYPLPAAAPISNAPQGG